MLNNLHVWVFVKWELKELKLGVKKTSQNCRVSRKPGKEEPSKFLGGYFTFTIWDLGFRTSTDKRTYNAINIYDSDKLAGTFRWSEDPSQKIPV